MHFHHLHFYVKDAPFWRDWFIRRLAFQRARATAEPLKEPLKVGVIAKSTADKSEWVTKTVAPHVVAEASFQAAQGQAAQRLLQGQIDIRLSDPGRSPAAAAYLEAHPPGLADIAFATEHFDSDLRRAIAQGATCLTPVTGPQGQRHCQLQGWGHLRHTLVEVSAAFTAARTASPTASPQVAASQVPSQVLSQTSPSASAAPQPSWLCAIDHVVLNVPKGALPLAVDWYQRVFGLALGQHFEISTAHSGLRSQVLVHPQGTLQLPINEPSSDNSQVQEFLNHNRGAGVQHVALRSDDAVGAIAHLRQQGLELISVPKTYYDSLHQRADCPIRDTSAASAQQLLLDWAKGGHQGLLMQTFTKPIFDEPTFFFEIIERGTYREQGQVKSAQGFGEGNFQALFEAIERDQRSRGSLAE